MMNFKLLFLGKSDNVLLQLFRYTFVGGLAFIVDFGLLYILTEYVHLHYLLSAGLAFVAGLFVNYVLSKLWVFSKTSFSNRWIEFLLFAGIGVIGLGLTEVFMWLFTDIGHIHYVLSKALTTIIVYFWNFLARKIIIF